MRKCSYYADWLVINGYESPSEVEKMPHYSLFYWGKRLQIYDKKNRMK